MQKLSRRNYIHTLGYSARPSLCGSSLNSSERVRGSVASLKTLDNNFDAALTAKGHAGRNLRVSSVYVLNKRGEPLMPCSPRKARILLDEGRAKVEERTPFVIQLAFATGEAKQPVILGEDSGYCHIGLSAITEKQEVLSAEVSLRTDIVKLNLERRQYRRARRQRKIWHRKPRFNNRKKPEGWLPPSIQHKLNSHIKLVEKIKKLLPISKVIVEVSNFDAQKMQNPEIKGVEYQQGTLFGYKVREYLLEKWGRKCAYCGKTDIPLQVEHIIPKSRGGTDRVSNLTISCEKCNLKKGNRTAEEFGYQGIQKQAEETLKAIAFMNSIRWKLVKVLFCEYTYGYITKHNRIALRLPKSHVTDAFVIAGGTTQKRAESELLSKQVRKCNRKLFRGNRSHIRNTADRLVHGFQRFDKVRWKGIDCFIFGRRTSGYFDLKRLNGTRVSPSAKAEELTLLESAKSLLTERRQLSSPV